MSDIRDVLLSFYANFLAECFSGYHQMIKMEFGSDMRIYILNIIYNTLQ